MPWPSTITRPWASQHCTVWPPTAMTRLTKSFSFAWGRPNSPPTQLSAWRTGLWEVGIRVSGSHDDGARNTTMSPGFGPWNQ